MWTDVGRIEVCVVERPSHIQLERGTGPDNTSVSRRMFQKENLVRKTRRSSVNLTMVYSLRRGLKRSVGDGVNRVGVSINIKGVSHIVIILLNKQLKDEEDYLTFEGPQSLK